jgi:glycosyltransferase involved in cell wall biosynthesis
MNNVIFLSSVLHALDYQERIRNHEILNPSHQQFMSRLAEAFAIHHEVAVISLPPVKKSTRKKVISQNIYHRHPLSYIQFTYFNLRFLRSLSLYIQTQQYIRHWLRHHVTTLTIVVDSNSRLAARIAKRWRHHPRILTIGVVTDDPRQLSKSTPAYHRAIFRLNRHYHRYIGITKPLIKLFNSKEKPTLIVPGMVEAPLGAARHPRPYFFFSGALFTRYGIESLIEGFLSLKQTNFDLLIAGYGPEASWIEGLMQKHRQLKFLGMLTPQETSKYQAGSYLNINPRPVDGDLDSVSIPSKVLDYIATGVPTLTTEHPFIKSIFLDTCSWISESSPTGIRVALERFLEGDYALYQNQAIQAKTIAMKHFSISQIGQALRDFTKDIK